MYEKLLQQIQHEFLHAIEKHPRFINEFVSSVESNNVKDDLVCMRRILSEHTSRNKVRFTDVLLCETLEAVEAYVDGDMEHAQQELAQCAAVCIRAMLYCQSQHKVKGV